MTYAMPILLFAFGALFLIGAANRPLIAWLVDHTARFEKAHAALSRLNEDRNRGVHHELLWGLAIFAGMFCLTFGLVFLIISIVGGR
jgi:uncharacterized membrane protein YqjE